MRFKLLPNLSLNFAQLLACLVYGYRGGEVQYQYWLTDFRALVDYHLVCLTDLRVWSGYTYLISGIGLSTTDATAAYFFAAKKLDFCFQPVCD